MTLKKRFFLLTVAWCFCTANASAQKMLPLVTVRYQQAPLAGILDDLEKQSGLRFFYDVNALDTMRFNLAADKLPLDLALQQLFRQSSMQFSIDNENHVFISRNAQVKTQLPPGFFEARSSAAVKNEPANNTSTDKLQKPEPATLENKLYVIGSVGSRSQKQQVTVTGHIQNSKTGEAVSGAAIFIDNSNAAVVSDQYGDYTISLPKGRHTLTIKSLAMKQTRRQLQVHDDGKLDISLQEEIMTLSNVLVRADKTNQVRSLQMGLQKVDQKAIKQVPVVFGETDVLRVAMTLPGVKTVGEASTGLNVRGGSADQNLILLNDATIYNPSHFFGLFSAFNAETVKDIQLYKSGIPVKYGGRLSSVLEVNTREGNRKQYTGSAGIGVITSRFNIEGPLKKDKSSFIFGARSTYANWLLSKLPPEYKNSKAGFYDINLNTTHELDSKNTLYLQGYTSHDDFNLNNDTTYSYGNSNFSAKWKHSYNTRWTSLLAIGYDHYQYGIGSDTYKIKAFKLSFDINQYYLKAHVNYFANADHNLEMGVSSLYYRLHPGSYQPQGPNSTVIPVVMEHEQALESALYFSDKYRLSNALNVEAGIRYSIYNYLGQKTVNSYPAGVPMSDANRQGSVNYPAGRFINTYHGPEFRITARYAFTNDFSVKASYNTQRQYIQMLSNTASMSPTDIWKLSDPNIRPQNGDQFSLGLYRNFNSSSNDVVELSLEAYYKRMKNFLDYKSGAELILNSHIETDVVRTRGKAYGIEFQVKKSAGHLNGWISYTYSRTFLQMNDSTQGMPVNNGAWYPANYDKPHDITMAGNYRISHRYSFSWNITYSTGRPITLPIGRYVYAGGGRTLYGDRNQYRIPDYMRADFAINIDGNHKLDQRFHNSWTFGVYNLTGRKNPYSVYYVTEGMGIQGYKLSIFGSIIPYVNFNIKF